MKKIPYLRQRKLAKYKISYYFVLPNHVLFEGCPIKSSTPLGENYFDACQKALELYKEFINCRKQKEKEDFLIYKSFAYIWKSYEESRFYDDLAPRTKKDYQSCKDKLYKLESKSGRKFKDIPLDSFDFERAENLYKKLVVNFKERWARYCLMVLRLVYNYGMRTKILTEKNPFENMRIKVKKAEKLNIPQDHIIMLINKAKELNLPQVSLAIELNYYLCQRPADVLELRKQDYYEKEGFGFFHIIQNKTGTRVNPAIPPYLAEIVKIKNDYIICDNKGAPYSVTDFGRLFKIINDACEFNYTFRLMRHAASTAYSEAGVNSAMVISLTGHANESIYNQVYKSNTEDMAISALKQRLKSENHFNAKK